MPNPIGHSGLSNPVPVDDCLPAEARARKSIEEQLEATGWFVQDRKDLDPFVGLGIAVREMIMAAGYGRVDYLLYVDKKVFGLIEAKPVVERT